MNKLYQNTTIFLHIFSYNNPNGVCNFKSKTCKILMGLLLIILLALSYFLTSYILNILHQSYNISSKCPDQNCIILW